MAEQPRRPSAVKRDRGGRLRCLDRSHSFDSLASHISVKHGSITDYRERHADQRREPYDRRARELGFADLRELLTAHRASSAPALGELLGIPAARIAYFRATYARPAPVPPPRSGKWYRHVGVHFFNAHDIDADEYRRRHGLPATRALCAQDLREFFAEKATDQYANTSQIQGGFAANGARLAEQGPPPRTYTGDRAGVRAIRRRAASASAGRSNLVRSEHVPAQHDVTARELGYAGVADLLDRNRSRYGREVGEMLGVSANTIARLRKRLGLPTRTKRRPEDHHKRPERPVPVQLSVELAAELAQIPSGVQPEQDGSRRCLECGTWVRGLGQHVALKHGLGVDDYRRAHGLPTASELRPPRLRDTEEGRAALAERLRALARQSALIKQLAADERYQRRARELGHAGLAELLAATADLTQRGLAELVGVSETSISKLRKRHGIPSPGVRASDFVVVPRQSRPTRVARHLRPSYIPGLQPEEHGQLQCLECGSWYRGLAMHLYGKHGIDVDDYRREYELPAGRGLVGTPTRELMAQRGRDRLARDEKLREALTTDAQTLAERRQLAFRQLAESRDRAGVQAAWRASALHNTHQLKLRNARRHDERAAELGHSSMAEMLAATTAITADQLAGLLGYTTSVVTKLRARHGVRSVAQKAATAERHRLRAESNRPPTLPPGVQPRDQDGRLLCLECGRWYRGLANHIPLAHGIANQEYRERHQLARSDTLNPRSTPPTDP